MERPKICLCLTETTIAKDLEILNSYRNWIDMVELRVDCLENDERLHIRKFPQLAGIPCILTIRRKTDGGFYVEGEASRTMLFARALAFASQDIRKNFAQFVKREDISISGGLTIINSNYPIAKAATMAGEAEDEAKLFQKGKKNAINLFGETLSWDSEFSFVEEYKDLFVSLCNHQNMPVSILHKLMNYCAEMHRGELSYLWHTAYFIKRFAENKNSTVQSFLDRLMKDLSIRRNYELIAVSARWAELIIRINKQ